ncbi:single strand DNA binding protein [Lactococcus phage vB_Llc_bIBB94p4]|uniref:Single stranded DNA-binding protein n=1 Tax=Lactococcus phage vB_Llc_bIBB94p4 TaxID=2305483 RepID=A0A678VFK4_9CAUD|nr:single strand DNA binding protein [Lactococcus phage vB_Llc_bIBB94p4]AXY83628.1 putative single stranded DNA-binding protein [Lactococcus phage vB_Llc_bIBB94p4]
MKIIETLKVNETNTREVETSNGTKKVLSFKAYPFEHYIGGIWLPDSVNYDDIVTVYIDQVKAETKGDKTYYNASYAKVTPEFNLNRDNRGNVYDDPHGGMAPNTDNLFGGSAPADIPDDQLPF